MDGIKMLERGEIERSEFIEWARAQGWNAVKTALALVDAAKKQRQADAETMPESFVRAFVRR